MVTALAVTLGSLAEALIAFLIMRRFSTRYYFSTIKDIVIFLLPASLFPAALAATIGVGALYFNHTLPKEGIIFAWKTFFIGDSMGAYIFTPLLVFWTLYKPNVFLKDHIVDAILIVLAFFILNYFTFYEARWGGELFIPYSMWVAYRFRMHGATLNVFFIGLAALIPTTFGYGSFTSRYQENPLLALVIFLDIIVVISLVVAVLVRERQAAWQLLKNHNVDLEAAEQTHKLILEEMGREIMGRDKIALLNALTANMIKHLELPLKKINNFIHAGKDSLRSLKTTLNQKKSCLNQTKVEGLMRAYKMLHSI